MEGLLSAYLKGGGKGRRFVTPQYLYEKRRLFSQSGGEAVESYAEYYKIKYLVDTHLVALRNLFFKKKGQWTIVRYLLNMIAEKNGRWGDGRIWYYDTQQNIFKKSLRKSYFSEGSASVAFKKLDEIGYVTRRRLSSDKWDQIFSYAVNVDVLFQAIGGNIYNKYEKWLVKHGFFGGRVDTEQGVGLNIKKNNNIYITSRAEAAKLSTRQEEEREQRRLKKLREELGSEYWEVRRGELREKLLECADGELTKDRVKLWFEYLSLELYERPLAWTVARGRYFAYAYWKVLSFHEESVGQVLNWFDKRKQQWLSWLVEKGKKLGRQAEYIHQLLNRMFFEKIEKEDHFEITSSDLEWERLRENYYKEEGVRQARLEAERKLLRIACEQAVDRENARIRKAERLQEKYEERLRKEAYLPEEAKELLKFRIEQAKKIKMQFNKATPWEDRQLSMMEAKKVLAARLAKAQEAKEQEVLDDSDRVARLKSDLIARMEKSGML
jgi:hypothetical protein